MMEFEIGVGCESGNYLVVVSDRLCYGGVPAPHLQSPSRECPAPCGKDVEIPIDQDECIGCGSFQEICPEVFRLNREIEKSGVIKPEGGPLIDC